MVHPIHVVEGDPLFEYRDDAESSTCRPIVSYRCAVMVMPNGSAGENCDDGNAVTEPCE